MDGFLSLRAFRISFRQSHGRNDLLFKYQHPHQKRIKKDNHRGFYPEVEMGKYREEDDTRGDESCDVRLRNDKKEERKTWLM